MTLHVSAEKELVELKNTDGKTVKVELLEKGLDTVSYTHLTLPTILLV